MTLDLLIKGWQRLHGRLLAGPVRVQAPMHLMYALGVLLREV